MLNMGRTPIKYLKDTYRTCPGHKSSISRTPSNVSGTSIKYL